MDQRRILISTALLMLPACSMEPADGVETIPNLYLWLHGADDLVPESINPSQKSGASAIRLGEALRLCGVKGFTVVSHGLSGEEVYLPSTENDIRIVRCVKSHVTFGFSANRALPTNWKRGEHGQPLVADDGD
ncbi:hypothetical protein [Sphingomonas sp. R1]|uniref:hypothetical protein n=1 Tax=Sphingomonas sp. R1 TaxID=399176 RepID=UPI00222566B1|nr:hypothetical protein [Sphingomonas sp. R1]UYY78956.1 hypothetical protein OIM94_08255 [Sphingomonas sp. R1]